MRLLAAAALTALLASAGELRIERVFGPEVPTGRYKHPASIEALANGDLYLVYYGGAGEYAVNREVSPEGLPQGGSARDRLCGRVVDPAERSFTTRRQRRSAATGKSRSTNSNRAGNSRAILKDARAPESHWAREIPRRRLAGRR